MGARVLIGGYYGAGNMGDELILRSMVQAIREEVPDSRITVVSVDPAHTTEAHNLPAVAWNDMAAVVTAADESDTLVLGGGGLFQDYWGFDPGKTLSGAHSGIARWSAIPWLSYLMNKPLRIHGVGVGPLQSGVGASFTRACFELSESSSVRHQEDLSVLESIGVSTSDVALAADPVFALRGGISEATFEASTHPSVAVCPRAWSVGVNQDYMASVLASACDALVRRSRADITFVPFQDKGEGLTNDAEFSRQIVAKMQTHNRSLLDRESIDFATFLKEFDVVVGVRLHSVILAALCRRPIVALAYDPKVRAVMRQLGVENYCVDLASTSAEEIERLVALTLTGSEGGLVPEEKLRQATEAATSDLQRLGQFVRHNGGDERERTLSRDSVETLRAIALNRLRFAAKAESTMTRLKALERQVQQLGKTIASEKSARVEAEAARVEAEASAAAADRRVQSLTGRIADLRYQVVYRDWKVSAMRSRRWWQLGVLLLKTVRSPSQILRLPVDLLRLALKAPDRPARPRRPMTGSNATMEKTAPPEPTPSPASLENASQGFPMPQTNGRIARPTLRVAGIMDEFSRLAFRYEFDYVDIRPTDWRRRLDSHAPDLLLVESAWQGNDGTWQSMIARSSGSPHPALMDLVSWCRDRDIPTAFWNKEDPPNYEVFIASAQLFDFVFTVDVNCIERYRRDLGHDRVSVLPFGAQPRIHNPVAVPGGRQNDVAFAGTYYAQRHPERKRQVQTVLEPATKFNLDIYSRVETNEKYRFPSHLRPYIVGSVPYEEMLSVHKKYKVFLNVNSVINSPTMCARRVFELLAAGTPVVSGPSPALSSFFPKELVPIAETREETTLALKSLLASPELRDRIGVRGVREVLTKHSYSQRVQQILDVVGRPETPRQPLLSFVACTNKQESYLEIIRSVATQSYGHKELVIVAHGIDLEDSKVKEEASRQGLDSARVVRVDAGKSLGHCLNIGIEQTDGAYVAKIDDDNFYAPNFALDLMTAFSYADAEIVGKWSHFTYLGSRNCLMLRFPGHEYSFVDLVAGSALIVRRAVFDSIRFPDKRSGEDTIFLRDCRAQGIKIFATDRFNYVYIREGDPSAHTWKVADEELLAKGEVKIFGRAFDHVVI